MEKIKNYAFIDGQNLYQWLDYKLDYQRFRIYLKDKYKVEKAYYFLWFKENENSLYEKLKESWFIIIFNQKPEHLKSDKKWNIDVNLVFYAMKKLVEEKNDFDKIILISWDGDFKVMVDYFIELWKFDKILTPNKKFASSLYKHKIHLDQKYFASLDDLWVKAKIEYKKKSL